jgi:hypothetical protein
VKIEAGDAAEVPAASRALAEPRPLLEFGVAQTGNLSRSTGLGHVRFGSGTAAQNASYLA